MWDGMWRAQKQPQQSYCHVHAACDRGDRYGANRLRDALRARGSCRSRCSNHCRLDPFPARICRDRLPTPATARVGIVVRVRPSEKAGQNIKVAAAVRHSTTRSGTTRGLGMRLSRGGANVDDQIWLR